jgi:hypothetical protein
MGAAVAARLGGQPAGFGGSLAWHSRTCRRKDAADPAM